MNTSVDLNFAGTMLEALGASLSVLQLAIFGFPQRDGTGHTKFAFWLARGFIKSAAFIKSNAILLFFPVLLLILAVLPRRIEIFDENSIPDVLLHVSLGIVAGFLIFPRLLYLLEKGIPGALVFVGRHLRGCLTCSASVFGVGVVLEFIALL